MRFDIFIAVKMWNLKKKLCGKRPEAPTAKRDKSGKLVTSHSELKKLFEDTYKNRLRNRIIKPELQRKCICTI